MIREVTFLKCRKTVITNLVAGQQRTNCEYLVHGLLGYFINKQVLSTFERQQALNEKIKRGGGWIKIENGKAFNVKHDNIDLQNGAASTQISQNNEMFQFLNI